MQLPHQDNSITIHYSFQATILGNGESPEHLRSHIASAFDRVVGYGGITGDGPAECEEYSGEAVVISNAAAHITVTEISQWLQDQVARGTMDTELLIRNLADAAVRSEAENRTHFASLMGAQEQTAERPQAPRG